MSEAIAGDPMRYINEHVGRRYVDCTLDNFEVRGREQAAAVEACRDYVANFDKHVAKGHGIVFIGPKGTGKDHLLYSTLRMIFDAYPKLQAGRIIYRDGLRLFAQFRGRMDDRKSSETEDSIVDSYIKPHLFAISDPLPPRGTLTEYEARMWLRIVDGRYREMRPTAVTINASSRAELEERMGAQATDRLCDDGVIVVCNWESYRKPEVTTSKRAVTA